MKLAAPDVVSVDYRDSGGRSEARRRPSQTDHRGRHVDVDAFCSESSDVGTSDQDASCRSVATDSGVRLVQSSVTGDWRFVTSLPLQVSSRSAPRRRRYGSMRPTDLGVGLASDISFTSVSTSSTSCQVGLDVSPSTSTVISTPELVDALREVRHEPEDTDVVLSLPSATSSSSNFSSNVASKDETSSTMFATEHDISEVTVNCASLLSPASAAVTSACSEEQAGQLPSPDQSAVDVVPASRTYVGSSRNAVVYSSDTVDNDDASLTKDRVRNSGVSTVNDRRLGENGVEMIKNCALSTQFATDADLEAELLSARLLRQFREAIKSAVDSISADRSHPQEANLPNLPLYAVPQADFTTMQNFVKVEHVQKFGRSFESSPSASFVTSLANTRIGSCSESSFRQLRLSNIPTLNGVSRCRRADVVRDDLTTVTHCRSAAVTQNVLRHRRSLPDASQLRSLSSRRAILPSSTDVQTRPSLLCGGSFYHPCSSVVMCSVASVSVPICMCTVRC